MAVICQSTNSPTSVTAPLGGLQLDLTAVSNGAPVSVDVVYTITGAATFKDGSKVQSLHAANVGLTSTTISFSDSVRSNGALQFGIMGRIYLQGVFQDNAYWQVTVA